MGKNIQPMYEELIHTPFFIYDPRNPIQGERRQQLAQTVDIVPTLAEFFQIAPPEFMDGHSLTPVSYTHLSHWYFQFRSGSSGRCCSGAEIVLCSLYFYGSSVYWTDYIQVPE